MPKDRKIEFRKTNKRALILCEGKCTERNYFESFKRDKTLKLRALNIPEVFPTKKNTNKELVKEAKDLIKEAKKDKNPYESVWVVVDKDGYTKHPEAFKQAKDNNINIAFSSISFEFWFLLHFEYTTRAFDKADHLIKYLKNYIENYEKNGDYYDALKPKLDEAFKNAKQVRNHSQADIDKGKNIYELNPYTDVDELVDELLNSGKS